MLIIGKMSDNQSNNKRIAKNTVLLYFRMLVSIVISLYTSRVVINTLGVEDFGIYGIVAGVVSMLTFLNTSMSGATSRFIIFSLGKKDKSLLQDTFSTAVIIHIIIAIVFMIFAESVGLWFVKEKLVIPVNRLSAAIWVYHFSILAAIATIIQTPYKANTIAYEKMDAFAYIEIINVLLKLVIVYFLPYIPYDKLVIYGVLYFTICSIITLIYKIYNDRKFEACKFRWIWDKKLIRPMLVYCGWDLFGNLSGSVKQQGTNIVINMFFGVLLNAASSVATQVQSAVSSLAANVIQAFRPQIIKNYAIGNIQLMESQVCNAIKYTLILYCMCVMPLSIELDYVLRIWLGVVPDYAVVFCRLMLSTSALGLVSMIIITTNHATGKIKYLSVMTGVLNLTTIPIIYSCYKYINDAPEYAYYVGFVFSVITVVMNLVITNRLIPTISILKILNSIIIPIVLSVISFIPQYYVTIITNPSLIRLCVNSFISVIISIITVYCFVINDDTRIKINRTVLRKFNNEK